MPDGAVIIAAITSCTNTSNPRNVIAAALLARNANARGLVRKPWVKTSLAPGSKAVQLYLESAVCCPSWKQLGFGIVAFACTTCNGMSGALDPKIQQGDHRARSVCHGGAVRQSQFRWPHSSVCQAGLPGLSAAGGGLCHRGHGAFRYRSAMCLGIDADGKEVRLKDIWPSDAEIDAIVAAHVKPEQFRAVYEPMFARSGAQTEKVKSAVSVAPAKHLHPPSAVLGRRTWRASAAAWSASAGGARRQHHHRSSVALQRDLARQRSR
jgi:aconitate hydratase